jgi:hypothetical protein
VRGCGPIKSAKKSSSPERPSFGLQSDIVGSARQGAARHALPSPNAATCGHRRQAGGPPQLATAPAVLAPLGIRRRSSVVVKDRGSGGPPLRRSCKHAPVVGDISDRLPAVIDNERRLYARPAQTTCVSRGAKLLRSFLQGGDLIALPPNLQKEGLYGGHLALHQRAGLPFRWSEHRANGPTCQPPILASTALNRSGARR